MNKNKIISWIKNVLLCLSVIYMVIQIISIIPFSSTNIEAKYTISDQIIPYKIVEFINKDKVQYYISQIPKEQKDLLQSVKYYTSNSYKLINITISNNTNKEIEDLRLESKISGIYQIERTGEKIVSGDIDGALNIGSLRPSNKMILSIWGDFPYTSDEQFIKITHKNGYTIPTQGIYVFSFLKDVDDYFDFIKQNIPFVIIMLFFLLIMFCVLLLLSGMIKTKPKGKSIAGKKEQAEQDKDNLC